VHVCLGDDPSPAPADATRLMALLDGKRKRRG
jgi:hypothetical protein